MKKIFVLLMMFALFVTGCGGGEKTAPPAPEKKSTAAETPTTADKKFLVIYFSRIGEEYAVGNITKGNTEIVAEIIAKKIGGDLFEIKPAKPYPDAYEPCTEIAKRELEENARPAFEKNIDSLAQYDTIFIGYPIWLSAVPRVMMTFLEANDFAGKKIIPFCTHGGSGLAGTEHEIADACPKAEVLSGFAISGKIAQTDANQTESIVETELKRLNLLK